MKNWYKYSFLPFCRRRLDKILMSIAWSLPKSLVKWCCIRVFAIATTGKYSNKTPDQVTIFDALEAF
jgi:hypothetical protein